MCDRLNAYLDFDSVGFFLCFASLGGRSTRSKRVATAAKAEGKLKSINGIGNVTNGLVGSTRMRLVSRASAQSVALPCYS